MSAALGVEVKTSERLAVGAGLRALDLVREVGDGAVLCTHGDVTFDIQAALRRQGVLRGPVAGDKASTLVLELDGERIVAARRLAPPA